MAIGATTKLLGAAGSAGKKSRMAGDFLKWLKNTIKYGATGGTDIHGKELALQLGLRLGPDVIQGSMYGMAAPGDLGDKVIAGLTDTALSAAGGIGVSGSLRGLTRGNKIASYATDMLGSYGGMYSAYPVSEKLLQAKDALSGGSGQSPYQELESERIRQIEVNLLKNLGLM